MAISKKDANKKYDELRAKLKSGEMSKKDFTRAANRIYEMYHSPKNKAARKAKPASKPPAPKSKMGAAVLEMGGSNVKKVKPKKQSNAEKAASNFYRSSSGTRGKNRPSNPPSPTVKRRGSETGATVDPRERGLRKNRQQAKRSSGSSSAGRRNIARMVAEQSGSKKRSQKLTEARRRRARLRGAQRNRRQMLSRKYNKD